MSAYIYWKDHSIVKKEANPTSGVGAVMIKYGCSYFSDLVAIPDFASGAMENWGLITYRETSLLFDPKTSSTSDKLWVTEVIAHELAHQVPDSHSIVLVSVPKSIMQNTPSTLQTMQNHVILFPGGTLGILKPNTIWQVAECSSFWWVCQLTPSDARSAGAKQGWCIREY